MNDDTKGSRMLKLLTALAVGVAGLVMVPTGAHADTHCVTPADAGAGDDVVCVPTNADINDTPGDDTYLIPEPVGTELKPVWIRDVEGTTADSDTISLEHWSVAWEDDRYSHTQSPPTSGGLAGAFVRGSVGDSVDTWRYTPFADTLGQLDDNVCAQVVPAAGIEFELGAGNDRVRCVAGVIRTGDGDDDVYGVSPGTTVDLGTGNDNATTNEAIFNPPVVEQQSFSLTGSFRATQVAATGGQVVNGGAGVDTVNRSADDTVSNVEILVGEGTTPKPFVPGVTKKEYRQVKLGMTKARVHSITDVKGKRVWKSGNKEKRVYKGWKRGVRVCFVFKKQGAHKPWRLIRKGYSLPGVGT